MIGFEDIAGDRATFFARHFHRRALLRRRAVTDRLGELMSAEYLLRDVMASGNVAPRYVRLVNRGVELPRDSFTAPGRGPDPYHPTSVVAEHVADHVESGATLICHHLERYLPPIRRVADSLGAPLGCDSEAIAFLTPARNTGLDPHTDADDVFVIHVEGTKDWKVWECGPRAARVERSIDPSTLAEPVLDVTLGPGDVLYIPPGTPHVATAPDSMSLHLSMTLEPQVCGVSSTAMPARAV